MDAHNLEITRTEALYVIRAYINYNKREARTGRSPIATYGEVKGDPRSMIPLGVEINQEILIAIITFNKMKACGEREARQAEIIKDVNKVKPFKMSDDKFFKAYKKHGRSTYHYALDCFVRFMRTVDLSASNDCKY